MAIGVPRPLALEKPQAVDLAQAARYFGAHGEPDAATLALLQKCAVPLLAAAMPQAVWLLADTPALTDAGLLPGEDVHKHLTGCGQAILLAVTLGPGVDAQIRRAGVGDIAAGVASDALGSALAEQTADAAEAQLRQWAATEGKYLTGRFSPGYGDWDIAVQPLVAAALDTVRKAAKEFLTAQAIPVENLSGIGVSATGQIDSRKGIVAGTCGNFPNYIGSPIKAALEQDFGLPVTVANDANCMTLGEVWVGGAQGYTDVIGVTLGTGVGGGILTGGRLLEGARGLGGELGHYRTHALDGVPCTCGATGCWERYAATTALVRAAKEKNPAWTDGRAIFAAAEAGDPEVLALLDAWTDEIAQGLAGMVHIFNPQLILIGGGVSAQQKLLIAPIAAKVKASVMPAFAEGLEIRAAQLHNDAGMVGAVYYFRQTMEKE